MSYNDRPLEEQRSPSNANPNGAVGGLIQSPDINRSGDPTQHAVRDISMAREIVRTLQQACRNRSITNARIQAKINSERPYEQKQLEAEGLGWRNNFSTRPMSSILEKIFPRFVQAIAGLKYVTNSSLSDKWENSVEKSELFRKAITDCIRGRAGWQTLIEDIAFTNSLYGHAVVAWLNEVSWWPKTFQQDESFVTDGCKQRPEFAQVVVLKQTFLPHELFEEISDRESAEDVGWNIKATIEAINNASPSQIRDMLGNGGTIESWYENARRELSLGVSYMGGASVIAVYNLLTVEVTGKVSHYRLAGEKLDMIFHRDDRFASPQDCLAFYAFERGNGTLHGSKGLGRQIYELAGMMDRARNEIVDRAILSGKMMVQGDPKRLHTFRMSVIGSMVIIPNGWEVLQQRVDGDIEPFLRLDAYFAMLIDQLVGNVSPPQMATQGEAFRSPAAWNLLAAREEESKDAKIVRFMENFVSMIQTMQRRICDPDVVDDDAKDLQKKLLERMTRKELDEISKQPVAGTVRDLTPLQRQMIVAIAAEKQGNPLFNQRALQIEDLTARMDAQFAERVLLPVEDPTEEKEQQRLQLFEIALLSSAQPVPISPRDNQIIHLKTLLPVIEQAAGQIMSGQLTTEVLEAMIKHAQEHVNMAVGQGVPKDDPTLQQAQDLVKNAAQAINQLKEVDAQAAALQEQSGGYDSQHPDLAPQAPPEQQPIQ